MRLNPGDHHREQLNTSLGKCCNKLLASAGLGVFHCFIDLSENVSEIFLISLMLIISCLSKY